MTVKAGLITLAQNKVQWRAAVNILVPWKVEYSVTNGRPWTYLTGLFCTGWVNFDGRINIEKEESFTVHIRLAKHWHSHWCALTMWPDTPAFVCGVTLCPRCCYSIKITVSVNGLFLLYKAVFTVYRLLLLYTGRCYCTQAVVTVYRPLLLYTGCCYCIQAAVTVHRLLLLYTGCCYCIQAAVTVYRPLLLYTGSCYCIHAVTIQGVTGGTDQTSGGCSLCWTIPI